ncbi:S41 family peptidase [Candidatus Daviesbacteria bacterium]|nr:S41 family peptidase [Candidatus Daviesbacteria bacterium]
MLFFKRVSFVTVLIATLTFIIGWQLGQRDVDLAWQNYTPTLQVKNLQPQSSKDIDFKLFWQTWDLVSKEFVDKKAIDPQKMYYGAISGMVAALGDPYTVFLPPESQKATQEELGGTFEGVGIELGFNKEKRLAVIAPLPKTPAEKAGIKPGDIIVKINDKDTSGIALREAVNLIRGPKNSKVKLEIYHDGDTDSKKIELVRDTIVVKSVEFKALKSNDGRNIAYIKLTRFGDKTSNEWESAIRETLELNPDGVILDLRNNPGGYLEGSVSIASEFLKDGVVTIQENAKGEQNELKVTKGGRLTEIPLIVLINQGSASASEIVAGAIQDYKRGKLVGEISFGKGTIQEAQDLPERTGIHITTAKWLTPNGRSVHNSGLKPDVEVKEPEKLEENEDPQLDKALELF